LTTVGRIDNDPDGSKAPTWCFGRQEADRVPASDLPPNLRERAGHIVGGTRRRECLATGFAGELLNV
jgi:hypothetical protein